jgi:AraC-like DNA-binding protein
MRLYIKHMVSNRCKTIVREELNKHQMNYLSVDLGYVELENDISETQREQLKVSLMMAGLVLMDDQRAVHVERIKNLIIEMVSNCENDHKLKCSDFLVERTNCNYTYLSKIFSETLGINIEQFVISHKIKRVKELLIAGEVNLTQIAFQLNYSSVAHLSSQFKKVTGITPTIFKLRNLKKRDSLERV